MKTWTCTACFVFLLCAFLTVEANTRCTLKKNGVYNCRSNKEISGKQILSIDVLSDALGLDLSHNRLTFSRGDRPFTRYKKLTTLVLSHSHLREIPKGIFKGLASVTQIDLSNNDLSSLPSAIFDGLDNLVKVDLNNNSWDCSCASGLLSLLQRNNISLGPDPVLCRTPASFKETRIDEDCDKNECLEENDCDDMAVCTDTPKAYTCKCHTTGFHGSGKECTDIDECAGKNNCSKNGGKCMNTHGSYTCSCKTGYKGNGYACKDIDECRSHACGSGQCENSEGSFTCSCDVGYMENSDHVCEDIDECQTDNHTCYAIQHSYCHNTEKFSLVDDGYECLCQLGFRRVGRSCIPGGDVKDLTNILALIIGIFFGVLAIIITSALFYRKWKLRTPKADQTETQIVMAPVVGLGPPVDFAYLEMPQEMPQEDQGEWEELEDDTWLE